MAGDHFHTPGDREPLPGDSPDELVARCKTCERVIITWTDGDYLWVLDDDELSRAKALRTEQMQLF